MRKWIKLLAHLIAMMGYAPKSCNLFTSASLWRLRRIELLTSLRVLRNERSAPYPLILRASLDPSSFPARYQQNNNLIRELVAVEK